MTDETPKSEGEPSPASPEETPTAQNPSFTYDDAVKQAGDEAEPTQATPVAAAATAANAPAAAPATTAPADDRPAGIFIPKWVGLVAAAIVAALVFGGIGYAIGDSSSSDTTENAANTFPNTNGGQQLPGGGQIPGNNGGQQLPGGSGNGDSNGGGTTATDAGFLGVGVQSTDEGNGVEVTDVASDSPAAEAGLQPGDVITALDGDEVTSSTALRAAIQDKASGDEISITYTRDGTSSTVNATLTSRAEAQSS